MEVGTSLEIDKVKFVSALEYQKRFDFSQQDSIIYSSIVADVQRRPLADQKCFMSSNYNDFKDPGILSELNSYNCRYERYFGKGLSYIRGFI